MTEQDHGAHLPQVDIHRVNSMPPLRRLTHQTTRIILVQINDELIIALNQAGTSKRYVQRAIHPFSRAHALFHGKAIRYFGQIKSILFQEILSMYFSSQILSKLFIPISGHRSPRDSTSLSPKKTNSLLFEQNHPLLSYENISRKNYKSITY